MGDDSERLVSRRDWLAVTGGVLGGIAGCGGAPSGPSEGTTDDRPTTAPETGTDETAPTDTGTPTDSETDTKTPADTGTPTEPGTDREPSNVVLVMADDLSWVDLGCYGSEFHETPNIDRLADQGMRFTDAYSSAPLCSPTRASIQTGWSPARLHLHAVSPQSEGQFGYQAYDDWTDTGSYRCPSGLDICIPQQLEQFPRDWTTIAERLNERDYATGFFGKWHLGPEEDAYPQHQGYDVNVGGSVAGWPKGGYFCPNNLEEVENCSSGEYLTDHLTTRALEFIDESVDEERPFFAYLPYYNPHGPWEAPDDLVAEFEEKRDPDAAQNNPVYAAMLKKLDENVGRLLDKLDERGVADDTLVVFCSDNGGVEQVDESKAPRGYRNITSNGPLRGPKALLYEGGIRVPLIARWPSEGVEGESDVPVSTTDLYPTLLDAAGLDPKPGRPLDGESLLPVFTGSGTLDREFLTWFMPHPIRLGDGLGGRGLPPSAAIRRGKYKLLKLFDEEHGDGSIEPGYELYDLEADIAETNDIAPDNPDLVDELDGALMERLDEQNAYVPLPRDELPEGGFG